MQGIEATDTFQLDSPICILYCTQIYIYIYEYIYRFMNTWYYTHFILHLAVENFAFSTVSFRMSLWCRCQWQLIIYMNASLLSNTLLYGQYMYCIESIICVCIQLRIFFTFIVARKHFHGRDEISSMNDDDDNRAMPRNSNITYHLLVK